MLDSHKLGPPKQKTGPVPRQFLHGDPYFLGQKRSQFLQADPQDVIMYRGELAKCADLLAFQLGKAWGQWIDASVGQAGMKPTIRRGWESYTL